MAFHSLKDSFLVGKDLLNRCKGKVFGMTSKTKIYIQTYYSGKQQINNMLSQNYMMSNNYYGMYGNYPQTYGGDHAAQYFYQQGQGMDPAAAMYYQNQYRGNMHGYMGMDKRMKAPMMGHFEG